MDGRDAESVTTTRLIGDPIVVSPAGELDMATAPRFVQAIERAQRPPSPILVGLREVTFIDSMGIRALIQKLQGASKGVRPYRPTARSGSSPLPESTRRSYGR